MGQVFDFQGQTIDVSYQEIFTLKYLGLHDEEGKKINISDLITVTQRQLCHFLSLMMTVHPEQDDPTCKHS